MAPVEVYMSSKDPVITVDKVVWLIKLFSYFV